MRTLFKFDVVLFRAKLQFFFKGFQFWVRGVSWIGAGVGFWFTASVGSLIFESFPI